MNSRSNDLLVDAIANDGYAITPDFLPPALIKALADEAKALHAQGALQAATTGLSSRRSADNIGLRGDFIHWLEDDLASPAQQDYLAAMRQLQQDFNQALFMGLFELETHLAVYPPGAVYRKHLDQFQGRAERQVSCILYLNEDWQPEDGGTLRIYLNGNASEPYMDISPTGGTLVTFLSGRFMHEVMPSRRERISLTGWFRTRSASL